MINTVRNTVMAVLNKDNNGYVTPEEFNLFAKQAQLEIFEEYFYDYKNALNLQNKRLSNSGYADIPKQLQEVIDSFTRKETGLTYVGGTTSFTLPTDWYTLNTVFYNTTTEVERVNQNKITQLVASHLTAPTTTYPAYYLTGASASTPTPTSAGNSIIVYPDTITTNIDVLYVRYPSDPKWTYNTVSGSPVFNQSAADYQDFELPLSDQVELTLKILQYAGVSIREAEVVQMAAQEEAINNQQET
ncbi:MAG: putative structural protein [Prokaryotic dsDNA virus sp.]|jgi:hypothetical protein|nr:MAG: putative structural protein [Prokaryotic dsDNA virus sp.]|tara:strand:- start:866 stop:1600 length:735 start_codon:yes stop_codon:yes gene_type:complete